MGKLLMSQYLTLFQIYIGAFVIGPCYPWAIIWHPASIQSSIHNVAGTDESYSACKGAVIKYILAEMSQQ